jgi:hypothetical protein
VLGGPSWAVVILLSLALVASAAAFALLVAAERRHGLRLESQLFLSHQVEQPPSASVPSSSRLLSWQAAVVPFRGVASQDCCK